MPIALPGVEDEYCQNEVETKVDSFVSDKRRHIVPIVLCMLFGSKGKKSHNKQTDEKSCAEFPDTPGCKFPENLGELNSFEEA